MAYIYKLLKGLFFKQKQHQEAAIREVLWKRCSKNFTKFTGKHLCSSLFYNNFIKKETLAQVFFCEFCEIFKNNFSDKTPLVAASEHLTQHFH